MRPAAGATWSALYKDIKKLICKELSTVLNPLTYQIFAGSGKQSACGGHIHIGGLGHTPRPTLVTNYDKWISEPLNSISNFRVRGEYARLGQHRSQPHGFEYRSALSWISTPIICAGVLCVAKVLLKARHNINTIDELNRLACKRERKVIAAFYAEIEQFKTKSIKIDDIEVFAAWGFKPPRAKLINVEWNHDPNVDTIFGMGSLKCFMPMRFIGASAERANDLAIFVPVAFPSALLAKLAESFTKVRFERWGNSNFGISYLLRENTTLAFATVQKMTRAVNKFEREKRKARVAPTHTPVPV
jgi:hypothetical protein